MSGSRKAAPLSEGLLIFSDVHRHKARLKAMLKRHQKAVDHVYSLGDSELSTKTLAKHDIKAVRGNFPFDGGDQDERLETVAGRTLMFVHGHRHGVRGGLAPLAAEARGKGVDAVFYGHTHVRKCTVLNEVILINPGAINRPREGTAPSYLLVSFEGPDTVLTWYEADTHDVLEKTRLEL